MKRNVLIVEDKKQHIDAIVNMLSCYDNIEIYTARSVSEALNISHKKTIHLFLVDIVLDPSVREDMSGIDFVTTLRDSKKYKITPVIFITALEDPRLYSYSQLHCFGYIEKPFKVDKIREIIAEALEFPVNNNVKKHVYFRKDGIIHSLDVESIIYIVNSNKRLKIFHKNDCLEVGFISQKKILEELNADYFIPCSRYVIINKNYIEQIDYRNRYVKLRGIEKNIEIGTSTLKRFRESIDDN